MNKNELIKIYEKKLDYQNKLWDNYKKAEKVLDKDNGENYQRYTELEQKWLSFNVERILSKKRIYKELLKNLK